MNMEPLMSDDWTLITLRSFDDFRIGPHFRTPHRPETDPAAPAAANNSATTTANAPRARDSELETFRKNS
jgi:hypothetical protein